jgi:hypothetical protein
MQQEQILLRKLYLLIVVVVPSSVFRVSATQLLSHSGQVAVLEPPLKKRKVQALLAAFAQKYFSFIV